MPLLLGIDTGGTFTDAVVVDRLSGRVVGQAKSPTTHGELTIGIDRAVVAALAIGAVRNPRAEIELVSISTTLATNALVEGHGDPAGLVTLGFAANELARAGLDRVTARELCIHLDGGHDAHGNERAPIDEPALARAVQGIAEQVSAFAVAAQFSVRNPRHELDAAALIGRLTGLPVSTSHELSAKLHGPRRALTALLNARLIGIVERLDRAVASVLAEHNIEAPLMVVRGDGSLVAASVARGRPVETILSGPAASVLGAVHLSAVTDGLVVDIGGTTTDVAVISNGRPRLAENGAEVGGHHTMVEAVDMVTIGLGGDSEVRLDPRKLNDPLVLGPERAIPICRLAIEHPSVHAWLDRQLASPTALDDHGRFLVAVAGSKDAARRDRREGAVLDRLLVGPVPVDVAAPTGLEQRAAARLRARGLVRLATLTPTDAAALLGHVGPEDADCAAARKVALLFARKQVTGGRPFATDADAVAALVIDALIAGSADFVLRAALAADGVDVSGADALLRAALGGHVGSAALQIGLVAPITAIGAPARAYYGQIAQLVGTTAVVPEHADVANAVGAAVGLVRVRRSATITQPTRGQFRVHLGDQPTFGSVENARVAASQILRTSARNAAAAAGGGDLELTESWHAREARVHDRTVFVEGTLVVEASGRPRLR